MAPRLNLLDGEGNDTPAFLAPSCQSLLLGMPAFDSQIQYIGADTNPRALFQNGSNRPLAGHRRRMPIAHDHRQALSFEVVRDFAGLAGAPDIDIAFALEDRGVERIGQRSLEGRVKDCPAQNLQGRLPVHADCSLKADITDRQRAGFVGAQHVHRTEVFDCNETANQDASFSQSLGAARQRHGDDCRQQLRGDADSKRCGEQ